MVTFMKVSRNPSALFTGRSPLTIVALGLLAEPREERLAGEGVSHVGLWGFRGVRSMPIVAPIP
jgi:hypothetical protein